MHLKDPLGSIEKEGNLPGSGLPILAEVGITGTQVIAVICIMFNERRK
jgi:hypothetical protein